MGAKRPRDVLATCAGYTAAHQVARLALTGIAPAEDLADGGEATRAESNGLHLLPETARRRWDGDGAGAISCGAVTQLAPHVGAPAETCRQSVSPSTWGVVGQDLS